MSAGTQQVPIPWTPAPPQLVMAYSVCKGITRQNAKNFYYGFLVLPRRKREALCAVYAFMRRCDDITDDPKLSPPERRQQLEAWLDALHRAQQGQPTDDAILLALTDAQRRYAIPAGLLDELAHGTSMDLDESEAPQKAYGLAVQYKTFEDLRLYCYRVASVVGLVCIHIFGYRDPAAEPLAECCGLAFQLTNIIRDVKEDAGLGRVYLPEEDLVKVGLSASDVLSLTDPARLRPVLTLEADRAREFYSSGDALIAYIAEDSQPALWVLINIYRGLLEKIAVKQYDVFTGKIALSTWEKFRILGKGFLKRLT
ncbi:MAG: phytoene/squalene synthase family protein [Candidatus Sulfotelmatobacter sp.]